MCRFIETIRVDNGHPLHLDYHLDRMNTTRHHFNATAPLVTAHELKSLLHPIEGTCKWRIVYTSESLVESSLTPYVRRDIHSLKVVVDNNISYDYKLEDRTALQRLVEQKAGADEVLIVKDGLITDTSYTNVALWDGQQWLTPPRPLLPGTARRRLLDEGKLLERDITLQQLSDYESLSLFNAMIPLGEIIVSTSHVIR